MEPCLGLDASESARLKQNMREATVSEQAPDQSNMLHDCTATFTLCAHSYTVQGKFHMASKIAGLAGKHTG